MITLDKDNICINQENINIRLPVLSIESYDIKCQIHRYPDEVFRTFKMHIKLRQSYNLPFDSVDIESKNHSEVVELQKFISLAIEQENSKIQL